MFEDLLHLDNQIIIYLNSLGSETFDIFWVFITNGKNWVLLYALVTFLIIKNFPIKKALWLILIGMLSCFISLVLVELIKRNVGRFRPINNKEIQHFLRIVVKENNFSFVSGHSAFSMTFASYIFLILKNKIRYIYLIFIFPVLFAYSRLYLGVHFLSDILSGLTLGIIVANMAYLFAKKLLFNSANSKSVSNG